MQRIALWIAEPSPAVALRHRCARKGYGPRRRVKHGNAEERKRQERIVTRRLLVSTAMVLAFVHFAHAQNATLRFGQIPSTVHGVTSLYLFIAEKQGLFARENIALDVKQIAGGTGNMVAALDRGEVDVTQTATPYLIQAALNGSDAVAIAGEVANPVYSLVAKPQIGNFADLKGKLIGLSLPIDTISISTRRLLALKGLSAGDYRVKELVGTPLRAACLKSGECDAVPLGQPEDLITVQNGFRRLGVSTDAVSAFQFEVLAAERAFAQTHVDVMTRFVRAIADAFRYIRDPSHRDAVADAIVQLTGASAEIARQTLALYFDPDRGVLPKQAEIDLNGLEQVIAFMGQGGSIKPPLPTPDRFVELRYLRAAGAM
jgi:ABC-type nitrate/sulfonate/bicarbonate transport system substrate-binding protein